ncbi:MAG: LamG-like jellyroll fold domain-containing protein [Planctomycetota bacterium]
MRINMKPILTATALSAFCLGSAHAGLVAYYSFDSDFTDAEATTGGGTITGTTGTISSAAGDVAVGSGAARLDGTGPMSLAETIAFGASDTWSVAFWGKRDSDADVRAGMVLSGGAGFVWTPDNDSSSAINGLRNRSDGGASGSGPNQRDTQYDDTSIDYSIYNHWAVVADGSGATNNMKIYLNGDEVVSKDDALVNTVFSSFGGWGGSNVLNNYDGVIDELYIYDEAISESAVQALVPEPGSLALIGFGGLFMLRRRR